MRGPVNPGRAPFLEGCGDRFKTAPRSPWPQGGRGVSGRGEGGDRHPPRPQRMGRPNTSAADGRAYVPGGHAHTRALLESPSQRHRRTTRGGPPVAHESGAGTGSKVGSVRQ